MTMSEYPAKFRAYTDTGSIHEIDMVRGTYVRLMQGPESVVLRRDGEPMPMLRCTRPEIGQSLVIILQLREDGVQTVRTTSPVIRIEERDE